MTFPFHLYALAFISAGLTSFISLPVWRKFCLKGGLVDDPGHRKIHDQPIPLAGGLAVVTGLLLPTFLACLAVWIASGGLAFDEPSLQPKPESHVSLRIPLLRPGAAFLLRHGLDVRLRQLLSILLGGIGMLLVGILDDKHELRPRTKFVGQFLIALIVAASGIRITLFVPNLLFSYAVTILWIITVINAFNFMDNMNGLCVGLGAIGSWYFGLTAAASAQYLVGLIAFLTCGALLGFLPYNFPRATAFLGDGGSHLVGFLLAVLAILPHFYTKLHPHPWAVLIPLIVMAIPLLDLGYVVVLRWRLKRPFYQGDTNHLSHRLVRIGLSRTTAVLVIWAGAAAVGLLILLL